MKEHKDEEIYQALQNVLQFYNIGIEETEEEGGEHDYAELISKTQDKIDDLTLKAEEIYQRTGMTREQLEAYAANPNNFTKDQWEMLEKVRVACEKYKQEAMTRLPISQLQDRPQKIKGKKHKERFAKKKHWIPS